MSARKTELSPHCHKVLDLLSREHRPMPAYDILGRLRKFGIKAPPTVYRALETLMQRGLVHRIESMNAFVACHGQHGHEHVQPHSHAKTAFAVCRQCGKTEEIHDHRLCELVSELGQKLKFNIEREMLELLGQCQACAAKEPA